MRILMTYIALLLFNTAAFAQTQTINGLVADADSKIPLVAVTVVLFKDSTMINTAFTDGSGHYRFENALVGRYRLLFTYVGYKNVTLDNLVLSSGKQLIQDVLLEASAVKMKEVVVSAYKPGETRNEMATVSAKPFTVEETNRYAGSRADPARMASNFAGVQGADDSRNDIVIRGNSPSGVLWRIEGVDIFNPNHFAIVGTSGGPTSIINNKYLSNSDFFTGAFPAEFGNTVAGAFDLFLRNGNREKYEFSGQIGFLGMEALAEGPLSKKSGASFLATYRYSTLSLFDGLGIDIGTSAVPRYQDAFFRLNFPLKKNANLSVFGLGGMSTIDILISDQKKPERNIYGQNDRDQYFDSKMGLVGMTYSKSFSAHTYSKITLSAQHSQTNSHHELVHRHVNGEGVYEVDSLVDLVDYVFVEQRYTAAWFVNQRFSSHIVMKAGINAELHPFLFVDSIRNITDSTSSFFYRYKTRWDSKGTTELIQPYVQFKFKPNDRLTFNIGVHGQYFGLSNSISYAEPRVGLQYDLGNDQMIAIGAGMHSQVQNMYLYFYRLQDSLNQPLQPHNQNMDFTKALHGVVSYSKLFGKRLFFKTEAYYQYLYNVPVSKQPSSFSLINTGVGFTRFFPDTLVNEGTGYNYGLEVTLQRSFFRRWFGMISASIFDSRYEGSDGVLRNSDFNSGYVANVLGTKEWLLRKKNTFGIGGKITVQGGRWFGPVDTLASQQQREVVYVDNQRNTKQLPSYFRADLKLNYKINAKHVAHEFGLDLVNVFDTQNVLNLTYAPNETDPTAAPIRYDYQLGRLPLFYYRIDF